MYTVRVDNEQIPSERDSVSTAKHNRYERSTFSNAGSLQNYLSVNFHSNSTSKKPVRPSSTFKERIGEQLRQSVTRLGSIISFPEEKPKKAPTRSFISQDIETY